MRRSVLITITGLILLAVLVIYFSGTTIQSITNVDENINSDEDFFAENINVIKYNTDGTLYYEMQGTRVAHNKATDTSHVTAPVMTLYAANNVQWHAKALEGKSYNRQQAVDLNKEVVISKFEQNKPQPVLTLTTNTITLHPETNTFNTGDNVNIKTANTTTSATGMKANLDNDQIQLLNNVRSRYEK